MARIIIERPNELIFNSTINKIYIDDAKVGSVIAGKNLQCDIIPGKHTVMAKSTWGGNSKAIEVEVGTDEYKTIKLTAVKYNFWIPVLTPFFIASIIYLISIMFNVDLKFAHLMFGSLGLYLIYFFTFGRDTFWKLRVME